MEAKHERTGVQARPETVAGIVREFDRLFLRAELRHGQHRPEDLVSDLTVSIQSTRNATRGSPGQHPIHHSYFNCGGTHDLHVWLHINENCVAVAHARLVFISDSTHETTDRALTCGIHVVALS